MECITNPISISSLIAVSIFFHHFQLGKYKNANVPLNLKGDFMKF